MPSLRTCSSRGVVVGHRCLGAPRFLHDPHLIPPIARPSRNLSSSSRCYEHQQSRQQRGRGSFTSRLRAALRDTKVEWYPIPVGVGIGFLAFAQLYRVRQREKSRREDEEKKSVTAALSDDGEGEGESEGKGKGSDRPKKRKRIRPSGPWQVQVMSTLPLKAVSRVWGRFNELQIPYYLRVPGFRLYSWIFGVDLSEVAEPDLHVFPNLASFFYRTLRPGCRPLDPNQRALLSPADGKVLQFGTIQGGEVEQVKGMTYSLDALLGRYKPGTSPSLSSSSSLLSPQDTPQEKGRSLEPVGDEDIVQSDEEFARVNGISYTLPNLFSGPQQDDSTTSKPSTDASTTPKASSEAEVRADLALGDGSAPWYARLTSQHQTALYYVVVYLAPGDYHRFHSPTSWVVERRRHFAGELYSVSPYLQRTLPGLFTLNERVVLLGRWRWGFFSMTPVGATNVGSIKINFDRELRTNSLTTDTAADRAAEEAARRGEGYSGFAEATYEGASRLLGGHALKRGEEMGGFQLGSTVVIVFEAPASKEGERGGWKWAVERGQRIKMGHAMGWVDED
ncbi:MAG: phosphatidylserine decarboxylase 1 [Thelocarpon impressellum]|nr:MAG: phosphatidylserine decarboxylase 1 [Thelocarpon impressellum]